MPNFFDFHFHPVFKQYISNYEEHYPSKRQPADLTKNIKPLNAVVDVFDETTLHILASQCSLEQITKGANLLGVANIVTLEYAIASGQNLFGEILRSKLSAPLDLRYFDRIINNDISYYHLLVKELNLYSKLANTGSSKKDGNGLITILSRKNNNVDLENISAPTMAMAIEGGHNLNRNLITKHPGDPANLDKPAAGNSDRVYEDFFNHCNTVLTPGQSLTNLFRAMWAEDMDLLYVTLTHLTYIAEMPLATHAYGMKMLKHQYFHPAGFGITDAGKEVIDAAYGMNVDGRNTPVLIDIKHMGLKSRLDFYNYVREKNYPYPILATHMGVTGFTISEWINRSAVITPPGSDPVQIKTDVTTVAMENSSDELGATNYHFNPWSINLMDEDIVHILNTDGMIGVSLDRRVLGYESNTKGSGVHDNIDAVLNSPEYLSAAEYRYFFVDHMPDMPGVYDADAIITKKKRSPSTDIDVDPKNKLNSWQKEHLRELVNLALTIMHIVAVGINKTDKDPWAHITIGTDYDGLIDPINYSVSCENIAEVEASLKWIMKDAEGSYLHYNGYKYPKFILPSDADGNYDDNEIIKKLRDIMYNNGKNFLKKWYHGQL